MAAKRAGLSVKRRPLRNQCIDTFVVVAVAFTDFVIAAVVVVVAAADAAVSEWTMARLLGSKLNRYHSFHAIILLSNVVECHRSRMMCESVRIVSSAPKLPTTRSSR